MGTESLGREDENLFIWHDGACLEDYVLATYYVETQVMPELTALAIAREQTACTASVPFPHHTHDIAPHTARVVSVDSLGESYDAVLPTYRLRTAVYEGVEYRATGYWRARVQIAFPIANFGLSLVNMWNAVGGEVHRLGFLNAIRIIDVELPEHLLRQFAGPMHGVIGIRNRLGVTDRPIFCRSSRPAVGLSTDVMLSLNEQVLRGGFDVVKDDELACDTPLSPFSDRVERMARMVRRVEDETGEGKLYIANIIEDSAHAYALADAAAKHGADAVLVSPALQGLTIASEIGRRTGLAVVCHNSWADAQVRHPRFGISNAVHAKLQRICGADMIMLPGDFATEGADSDEAQRCIAAHAGELGQLERCMLVLAGGKSPEGLRSYCQAMGTADFMLIAATAVDTHPEGIEAGARAFREACADLALG